MPSRDAGGGRRSASNLSASSFQRSPLGGGGCYRLLQGGSEGHGDQGQALLEEPIGEALPELIDLPRQASAGRVTSGGFFFLGARRFQQAALCLRHPLRWAIAAHEDRLHPVVLCPE